MEDHSQQQQTADPPDEVVEPAAIDPIRLSNFKQKMQEEQNLTAGILAGVGAAALGAIIWAAVTVITDYQIGWMAIGIGFLVGYAIRHFGKGTDKIFGYIGAALALLSCLSGNILTGAILISQMESVPFFQVLLFLIMSPGVVIELIGVTFSMMDLLFYGLAIYEGYIFSFRKVTEAEVKSLIRSSPTG